MMYFPTLIRESLHHLIVQWAALFLSSPNAMLDHLLGLRTLCKPSFMTSRVSLVILFLEASCTIIAVVTVVFWTVESCSIFIPCF
ncbi:hypothetical protein JHK86_010088 [Glycine max]|nr:hypothetical protein JHK86_010088 [Glycine max]